MLQWRSSFCSGLYCIQRHSITNVLSLAAFAASGSLVCGWMMMTLIKGLRKILSRCYWIMCCMFTVFYYVIFTPTLDMKSVFSCGFCDWHSLITLAYWSNNYTALILCCVIFLQRHLVLGVISQIIKVRALNVYFIEYLIWFSNLQFWSNFL